MRYTLILFTCTILISCVFAAVNGGGATASGPQNSQPGSSVPQNQVKKPSWQITRDAIAKEICEKNGHYGKFGFGFCSVLCVTKDNKPKAYDLPPGTPCRDGGVCQKPYCIPIQDVVSQNQQ